MDNFLLSPLSTRPRLAMISLHGYVAASPPLGAAGTGGQVLYVLERSKKLADLGFDADTGNDSATVVVATLFDCSEPKIAVVDTPMGTSLERRWRHGCRGLHG